MSVEQIVATIESMTVEKRREFVRWVDDRRQELVGESDFELSREQKAELLRRKKEFLADPTIAKPWKGTIEKIRKRLHARRAEKASASRC